MPKGTSTSPAFLTAPSSEKMVVPGVRLVPMAAYQSAPRVRIGGTLAQVFTLLTTVGLPHRPLVTGYGGRVRGSPAVAFERFDQGRFFAADVGPGPAAERDAERPAAAEDVLAQQAALLGLVDGVFEDLDGQRILVADVDEPFAGADGIASR